MNSGTDWGRGHEARTVEEIGVEGMRLGQWNTWGLKGVRLRQRNRLG